MYLFTDDCVIGVDEIDDEHRGLFEIINKTHDLLMDEYRDDKYDLIKGLIKQLEEYADTHFEHEEEYMRRIDHPELKIQEEQHNHFRIKVSELEVVSLDGDGKQDEVIDDILRYLVRWLYKHIIGSDMLIGKMKPLNEWKQEENPYKFGNEYLTGISFVDKEHKELFRIIGEVSKLMMDKYKVDKYDDIVLLLNELKDYTEYHFKDEEEYMQSIQYEGLALQKIQHEAFVERLAEVNLDAVDEGQDDYLEELLEYLTGWLINHIVKMDKRIPVK